jgi:hypothetical protein
MACALDVIFILFVLGVPRTCYLRSHVGEALTSGEDLREAYSTSKETLNAGLVTATSYIQNGM